MGMMTYKDFVSRHKDPILSQSDETVQAAVFNWFKYRYIGFEDPDKFLDILQRNVSINYPIYQQKLRIEPGVSQYDWLVSDYRERQLKSKGQSNSTVEYNSTTTGVKSGSDTVVKTGSQDTVKSGNDTTVRTGDQINTKTGSDITEKAGTQTNVRTGNQENIKQGGHTETDISGTHTTETSPHVSKVTTHGGHTSSWDGTQQVQANTPMSVSYSSFTKPAELQEGEKPETQEGYFSSRAKAGMPSTLDNSSISAQAQSYNNSYNVDKTTVTEDYKYDKNNTPDTTVTKGDKTDPDTKHFVYDDDGEKDTTTYNEITDTSTFDGIKDTHTYNNIQDTTTYNGITDTHSYNDVKDTTSFNEITDKHTYDDLQDKSEHTGSDTTTGGDQRTDRERTTGRNEDPATLLEKATHFIERSSAFMWFKGQIDNCFYPGYYTDDNDEGSCFI